MMPRGSPYGADAETTARVVRSFLVVRIIRGSLLLVALALAIVGVEVNGWPTGVAVALGLALLMQAAALVANCRRYAHTGHASAKADPESPPSRRTGTVSGERDAAGRAGRVPRRPGPR